MNVYDIVNRLAYPMCHFWAHTGTNTVRLKIFDGPLEFIPSTIEYLGQVTVRESAKHTFTKYGYVEQKIGVITTFFTSMFG